MKGRSAPRVSIAILAISHTLVLFAGFVAPYNPSAQNRDLPFAPPSRLHFIDRAGKFHLRPFVYRWTVSRGSAGDYREDEMRPFPIRLFVRGPDTPSRVGPTFQIHLFGVDEPVKIFLGGSDAFGRDQFSRFLCGGRISLFAGLLATAISLALGLALGGFAGYYGGWLDEILMRAAEIFLALPWLYLLLAVRAFLPLEIGPNKVFLLLIIVIGAVGWARPARLIRGVVLSAKERDYVRAAKGFGASDAYLLRRHVLPQVSCVIFPQAAVFIPRYVLAEVVLSFFGLGVSEPTASWGNLLANLRQYNIVDSYWWMFLPALALIPIFLAYYRVFSYYASDPRDSLDNVARSRFGEQTIPPEFRRERSVWRTAGDLPAD